MLPGFPDADSFVKVSPRGLGKGLGEHGSPPRPVRSGPGPLGGRPPPPAARTSAESERQTQPLTTSSGEGVSRGPLRVAPLPRALALPGEPSPQGFLVTPMSQPSDLAPAPPETLSQPAVRGLGCRCRPRLPASSPAPGPAPLPSPGLRGCLTPKPGLTGTCYCCPRIFLLWAPWNTDHAFSKEHRAGSCK